MPSWTYCKCCVLLYGSIYTQLSPGVWVHNLQLCNRLHKQKVFWVHVHAELQQLLWSRLKEICYLRRNVLFQNKHGNYSTLQFQKMQRVGWVTHMVFSCKSWHNKSGFTNCMLLPKDVRQYHVNIMKFVYFSFSKQNQVGFIYINCVEIKGGCDTTHLQGVNLM